MKLKNILLTIIFLLIASLNTYSQEVVGQWNGILKVQGLQLRLVIDIKKTENGYTATMDSPDQGAKGIPVTSTTFENKNLKFEITNARINYEGILNNENIIEGTFKQNGQSFPLNFSKEIVAKEKINRPQEPTKPYSYQSEDVFFENKTAGIKLAGTLTLPQKTGSFPTVILINGSGPQNRDSELLGHKPFLILSDFLTKNGFAVLRFDDRGTALSEGDFKKATTEDFSTDVLSAITYLKTRPEIDKQKIGLIGHSEGGVIAPMVANKSKDISFVVLMAGTGILGDELLLLQQKLIGKSMGATDDDLAKNEAMNKSAFEIVKQSKDTESLTSSLTNFLNETLKKNPNLAKDEGLTDEDFIKQNIKTVANPWMMYFIKYNPASALEKLKCPVLALNGEKDLQVPPKENLNAIKKALEKAKNKDVTTIEIPNLNHLFQECKTGAPSEYANIEQTISPTALNEILKWLQSKTK